MRTTVYYYLDNDGGMQYYKYYKTKGSYAILNSSFSVKSQKVDMGCCGARKDNGLYYSKTKTYTPTASSWTVSTGFSEYVYKDPFNASWFCVGVNYYITLKSGSYVTTVSTQNLL